MLKNNGVIQSMSRKGNCLDNSTQQQPMSSSGAVCTNCQHPLVLGAKFCSNCGTPVQTKKFCPNCGNQLDGSAKFCPNCGKAL